MALRRAVVVGADELCFDFVRVCLGVSACAYSHMWSCASLLECEVFQLYSIS